MLLWRLFLSFSIVKNVIDAAFVPPLREVTRISRKKASCLNMVFDFFRKRAEEGVEQLSNLATSASEGRIQQGLLDVATYTEKTNEAFANGLSRSRNQLLYNLDDIINSEDGNFMEELEDVLLQADIGVDTTEDVIEDVKTLRDESIDYLNRDKLRNVLKDKLSEALEMGGNRSMKFSETNLTVWFIMGANGMGKTTSIGKLAKRLKIEGGQKVLVAACDTFRAAAVEQLEMWTNRANVTCYAPKLSGDSGTATKSIKPSTVLYGALDVAIEEKYDILLVDTSGRLSSNEALTAELVKMKNVIQKKIGHDAPHEILCVLDAAQGRMAVDSAREWNENLDLTGLILTKLDGSAKGGSVVALSRELRLPVKLVGVGEGIDDLKDFDPDSFLNGLLGTNSPSKGNLFSS